MSDFNWCHGTDCHKRNTLSRVRGNKGSKVLRTRKVPIKNYWRSEIGSWTYFCDDTCMRDYIEKHIQSIVAIAPRTESLETPIDVVVEDKTDWHGNPYRQKSIRTIDND
tara:strand:+ start:1267 stop:1593 length:327 start_codon:yes stop_codon:yes gene_type:complete